MKIDNLFYRLFQILPSLLFGLLGESPADARRYRFEPRAHRSLGRGASGFQRACRSGALATGTHRQGLHYPPYFFFSAEGISM
ncbi:MAG: DUF2887 domain-containing protein [Gammaproteobacteria bacterium]